MSTPDQTAPDSPSAKQSQRRKPKPGRDSSNRNSQRAPVLDTTGAVSRANAAKIVHAVLREGLDLDRAIAQYNPTKLDSRDRALAQRLAYSTLRWLPALQFFSRQLLSKPLADKEYLIACLLWVGLVQLWREQMPGHAVVHSTVAATQKLQRAWAKGMMNACLRRFQREKNELSIKLQQDECRYTLPAEWLHQLRTDWPQHWESIVQACQEEPPMWLRVNARLSQRDQYLARLQQADMAAETGAPAQAIVLQQACPVDQLPGFAEGLVAVQDAAAQWAVDALDLHPNLRVLDACAAPGGKTCHILERQPKLAALLAIDRDPQRVERIRQNLQRLRLEGPEVSVLCADASEPASWAPAEGFDRILLDAPCSASGVIRRHPDIPWRRSPADVAQLNRLQAELLKQLWPLLRPGGILVYVTCSIFASENQLQIQHFLSQEPSAQALALPHWGVARGVGRQWLPGAEGMDGFFYAALRRSAE